MIYFLKKFFKPSTRYPAVHLPSQWVVSVSTDLYFSTRKVLTVGISLCDDREYPRNQ